MSSFGSRSGFGSSRGGGDRNGGGSGGSCVMYVPAGDCGKIIGKGGSKIRDMQNATGAKIRVAREDHGDGTRKVEVTGAQSAVADAERMIQDILDSDDDRGNYGRGGGGGGRSRQQDYDDDRGFSRGGGGGRSRQQDSYGGSDSSCKEVINIDSSLVGKLIGKGGSRIRELQDDTGCRINVSRERDSGGRTGIELIGSRSAIKCAKDAIDDITSQSY